MLNFCNMIVPILKYYLTFSPIIIDNSIHNEKITEI